MTRKKVKLAYITNDSARKATFKKRKKGLMKKVNEMSTLCGIDTCAIIYSPYDAQPEVWPSPLGAQHVLSQFKKMPEMEQSKKMVNQESFLGQRIAKANEQLKKKKKENREKEMTQVMFQCLTGKGPHNMNMMDLNGLGWIIDQYLKEIDKRVESLPKDTQPHAASSSSPVAPPPPPPDVMLGNGSGAATHVERQSFGVNMDSMQSQQPCYLDLMNSQMGFGCDEIIPPFVDNNNNGFWSNSFFP
ncbi:SRF-TF domain-containing protein [Cephalotus follicularis]|uniref:SRF-TF domain-containing protein n=1 Tax=Cephalotus follicularis TaxID=3775 RepID=A0A1Q3CT94_CEPFO|nr:SRF-TF domain-containing protein [Cephalotus follicularis]